jgi:hypothetical protein
MNARCKKSLLGFAESLRNRAMTSSNPLINALLAAVLGFFVFCWLTWFWNSDSPLEHKRWLVFVTASCAVLGFYFGTPFVDLLVRTWR